MEGNKGIQCCNPDGLSIVLEEQRRHPDGTSLGYASFRQVRNHPAFRYPQPITPRPLTTVFSIEAMIAIAGISFVIGYCVGRL